MDIDKYVPLLRVFWAHLDTPVSLSCFILLANKEYDQLATRFVDPNQYPEGIFSSYRYWKDAQAVDILRKYPLPTTFSRIDNAIAAWELAEEQCYLTNERIDHLTLWNHARNSTEGKHKLFLSQCRKRMSRWLGPIPNSLHGKFGPGTCFESEIPNPTVVDKLWLTPNCTPECEPIVKALCDQTLWFRLRLRHGLPYLKTCRGNRFTTVPKDGKADRSISIEPLGNLWCQLAIGSYLKKRLQLVGLPHFSEERKFLFPGYDYKIGDTQEVHRRLARDGVADGYATIDLSSASDTMSSSLIREILPYEWWRLMDDCRSKFTRLPCSGTRKVATWRKLEKFSSMGNGFTFELETFCFLVLLCVGFKLTPGVDIWVFGDDIIIPEHKFSAACNLLGTFGFSVNRRKSYGSGPFRESCGGNYHGGWDVTTVRIKGELSIPALYSLNNALARLRFPWKVRREVVKLIPLDCRFPGPSSLGDVVLHHTPKGFKTVSRKGHPFTSWVRALNMRPVQTIPLDRWSSELQMAACLLTEKPSEGIVRRGTAVVPRSVWASVS